MLTSTAQLEVQNSANLITAANDETALLISQATFPFCVTVKLASWSSGNMLISELQGLRFKSPAGKLDSELPTFCHHCTFRKELCCLDVMAWRRGPANSLHASA